MNELSSVVHHYDLLIEEENDPFNDSVPLQEYMNKWDGQVFLDAMCLSPEKQVLEIGVGTGRIAGKVAPLCLKLTGIDISPKTIERARLNLSEFHHVELICDDFMTHEFVENYDVIYSSLTMMHFEKKQQVIAKVEKLLKNEGIFCLSIDKNQSEWIDMANRKVRIYPDTVDAITDYVHRTAMNIQQIIETEFAWLITCRKEEE